MSEKDTRVYEIGFILTPNFTEGEVEGEVNKIKEALSLSGAEVVSFGNPEFIDLAYTMDKNIGSVRNKYTQGYFGFVKFNASPEVIEKIKKGLDGMVSIIRYILIKTDIENTVVFKKPKDSPRREVAEEDSIVGTLESEEDFAEHEKLPELETDLEEAEIATEEDK